MAAYPSTSRAFQKLAGLLILSVAFAPACGSSPGAPDPTPSVVTPQTATITYNGTFQSSNDSYGSITLTAQVPVAMLAASDGTSSPRAIANATGSLKPGVSASIPLTGTYDTVTGKFAVTGGGFTVNATVTASADGNLLNGTITTATTQGAVVALPPPTVGAVITYCGTFTGSGTGTVVVTRLNNRLLALVAEKGQPAPYSIPGTLNGATVDLSFNWAAPDVGRTTVTGTLNGGIMSGTWSNTDHESGTWDVRAGSCPLQ